LRAEVLGALPIVEHFLRRLGVDHLLESFVPATDGRVKLHPAKALGVVVRNLALCHQPLYSLSEWAAHFDPAALGLLPDEVRLLNDDRVGRALVSLFDADRASLLNRLVLDMVAAFSLDCSQLHNDSTSVTLQGTYRDADGQSRGSKPSVALVRGHSKDHRPDLLTELLKEFSQFRALPLDLWFMVPARGRRQHAQGSQFAGGALGGVVGGNRRSVGALSAA